ncbi:MAG: hypothetical protein ACRD9L_11425, partial [Bryobacteraceae bacterium]
PVQPQQPPEQAQVPQAASPAAAAPAPSDAPRPAAAAPEMRPERHAAMTPHRAARSAVAEQPPSQEQPTAAAAQPPANSPPPNTAQASDPGPTPARTKALEHLREEYNEMSVRASSVKAGMRSIEAQMASSGLGMRGDMKTTESRMDYLMQEAMSSIQSGDTAAAKKNLDSAELALETLERFLNH